MDELDSLLDRAVGRDPRFIPKAERVPVQDKRIEERSNPANLPDVEDDLETDPGGTFELELSDFQFLVAKIRNPPALRFTVTWKFAHPKYGLLGQSEEGWICTRSSVGVLSVSPPITRMGPMQTKQFKTITAEFHQLVLSMLVNNKSKNGASYAGEVGKALMAELVSKTPKFDPELPKEMKA